MQPIKKVAEQQKIPQTFFCIKQQAEKNTYDIYLYDDIEEYGDWNWETWSFDESECSAKHMKDVLNGIPGDATINLFINSNGGSVKEGTAIFNQLMRHPAQKTGYVDGVAHSIAFAILQACDHRIMGLGTSALIHEIWAAVVGNASELRSYADALDSLMESNRQIFMKRAKISEEALIELMQKETMLTPEQALEYGFCDEIQGEAKTKIDETARQHLNALKETFQKNADITEELKELTQLCKPEDTSKPEESTTMMGAFFHAFSKEGKKC